MPQYRLNCGAILFSCRASSYPALEETSDMNRTRPLSVLLAAALSLAVAPALAQEAPRSSGKPDRQTQRRAAFDQTDINKDGYLDRGESRAAREALFGRLDANKDGKLTPEEAAAGRRRQPVTRTDSRPTRAQRAFERIDMDKNGTVSLAEWTAADSAFFDRCDTNKDGRLAFDECRRMASRRRPASAVQ
jgi:Ca2+-binding EF-hand superfamily protein